MPSELPESHEVSMTLVPKPDEQVIWWMDELEGFIQTEAYC
jgi:hypothetical protein